jgi:hypothetical protein
MACPNQRSSMKSLVSSSDCNRAQLYRLCHPLPAQEPRMHRQSPRGDRLGRRPRQPATTTPPRPTQLLLGRLPRGYTACCSRPRLRH